MLTGLRGGVRGSCLGGRADDHQLHLAGGSEAVRRRTRVPADRRQSRVERDQVHARRAGGSRCGSRMVDEGAMLSIRDTGCGIAPDQLPVIFQPFEQIGSRYGRANGGTGLGLALVRSLTDLHGGTCRVDSEIDMGTLVTVFFPAAQAAAAASGRGPAPHRLTGFPSGLRFRPMLRPFHGTEAECGRGGFRPAVQGADPIHARHGRGCLPRGRRHHRGRARARRRGADRAVGALRPRGADAGDAEGSVRRDRRGVQERRTRR